jgi:hypothetical protein
VDETIRKDLEAYVKAGSNFAEYVKANYDSSADYWKLKTVLDAKGNVASYTVEWDDSLDLTIENPDGTTKKVAANEIQTEQGVGGISQWFSENGLAFGDDIRRGFVSLGAASEATKTLIDAVKNEPNDAEAFGALAKKFSDSIGALINSGLEIGDLGTLPDQSIKYSLMPDSKYKTTLYGLRLVTPELNGLIKGELYHWGTVKHDAEDISGGRIVQTPATTSSLGIGWNNMKGFQVAIGFDNGYKLESNHLSSDSGMNLLKSMLQSKNTEKISAGLQFATVGSTGTASIGPHNHLVGFGPDGKPIAPSDIFTAMEIPANYTNYNTALTGFREETAYNDPRVLQDIRNYLSAFDRQAYVDAHADLFQPYATQNGLVTYRFDILTMTYQREW